MNVLLYFGAKMVTFCIIHIGNRKIFFKTNQIEKIKIIVIKMLMIVGFKILSL